MNHVDQVLERAKNVLMSALSEAVGHKNYHTEKLFEANNEIEEIKRKIDEVLAEIDKRSVK